MVLASKTYLQIRCLIFRHPFTALFQDSRESFPPFMFVNVDQCLHIETLKIGKKCQPPLEMKENFILDNIKFRI